MSGGGRLGGADSEEDGSRVEGEGGGEGEGEEEAELELLSPLLSQRLLRGVAGRGGHGRGARGTRNACAISRLSTCTQAVGANDGCDRDEGS